MECVMRGYACIAMDNPKNLHNVGSAMRAMHCYGAKLLVVGGDRVRSLGGIATDTFKTVRHVPILRAEDQTLGARITDRCRDRVYIPTAQCMNLAACINVVLYDRAAKRNEWAGGMPETNAITPVADMGAEYPAPGSVLRCSAPGRHI
jgi:tRNA C32,U32 (ribose-2'-O)-methylase TrmJ